MSVSVGIDLGTTYSAVAYVPEGGDRPEIILNSEGRKVTPSVIHFIDGNPAFGTEAESAFMAGEGGCVATFKRNMGSDAPYCIIEGREYTSTDLSALLLRHLKEDAELELGDSIKDVVITVPAYFYSAEREATIRAAETAGLKVKKIIDEPNAAAMAYGLNHWRENANILVYDLGGGTFDVTLTRMLKGGVLRTVVTRGDHILGGRDWDARLEDILVSKFEEEIGAELGDEDSLRTIRGLCEDAKKKLSTLVEISVQASFSEYGYASVSINRTEFEEVTTDLLERTGDLCRAVVEEAGIRLSDVTDVLLVGGSTRMPQVSAYLSNLFGRKPITHVNPDEAVALGAAIQATKNESEYTTLSVLVKDGKKETDLSSVDLRSSGVVKQSTKLESVGVISIQETTAHAMGIIAVSKDGTHYVNDTIIPANHPRPVKSAKAFRFRTHAKEENEMEIFVLQGANENPLENQIPYRYVVSGIRHITRQRGNTLIRVQYSYDKNGVIQVEARQEQDNANLPIRKEKVPDDMSMYGLPIDVTPVNSGSNTHVGLYSKWAGVSRIPTTNMDQYGNAVGAEYDLIEDGAFDGEKIYILNLCSEIWGLDYPTVSLSKKGFNVVNQKELVSPEELRSQLSDATEFWLISDRERHITDMHIDAIKDFFEEGHGIYIWGDNEPYYADANPVLERLFHTTMQGNSPGDRVVTLLEEGKTGGIIEDHLISTGIENMYEGITIAAVNTTDDVNPLVFGSDGLVVTAYYDDGERRALIDGGFTRLYFKWDTAGTDRYIVNASAWLVNMERFSDKYSQISSVEISDNDEEENREVETWD